eukprot:401681_1
MAFIENPKHEYLHVLNTMDPCGQSDIISSYVEEAKDYDANTALEDILAHDDAHLEKLHHIQNKVIQILDGILNNGAMALDVAFCRLIIILPYVQSHRTFAAVFITFFLYFIVGSCFPSVRQNIHSISHQDHQFRMLRYLVETYFPNLNGTRCIKFKYSGNKATHAILSVLEQHITPCVASLICDYVQHPNHEFVSLIHNFLWHFPLQGRLCTVHTRQIINFVHRVDRAGRYRGPGESTKGHLLSRVLRFINHNDDNVEFEVHRLALMKLKTAEDISWYFDQKASVSVQCYVNPKLFIELLDSAVCNPWQVLRDAIVNHKLSIFFNGFHPDAEQILARMHITYKQQLTNAQYIFENIIVVYFDGNDVKLVRQCLWGLCSFLRFAFSPKKKRWDTLCEARMDVIEFVDYAMNHTYFEPAQSRNELTFKPRDYKNLITGKKYGDGIQGLQGTFKAQEYEKIFSSYQQLPACLKLFSRMCRKNFSVACLKP